MRRLLEKFIDKFEGLILLALLIYVLLTIMNNSGNVDYYYRGQAWSKATDSSVNAICTSIKLFPDDCVASDRSITEIAEEINILNSTLKEKECQ